MNMGLNDYATKADAKLLPSSSLKTN